MCSIREPGEDCDSFLIRLQCGHTNSHFYELSSSMRRQPTKQPRDIQHSRVPELETSEGSITPMADPLLTSRELLTSLLSILSQSVMIPTPASTTPPTSSLKLLPPSARPVLSTLHVIYPSLILPALDLLDRHLVTRVLVLDPPSASDEAAQAQLDASAATFHLVRSARQRRRGRDSNREEIAGPTYVVRTVAWNCSCAAFAFSAFTSESNHGGYVIQGKDDVISGTGLCETGWEFGGLSSDGQNEKLQGGKGSAGVPCCKHLLACVLAERWGVLGQHVDERHVSKEEGGGFIAGV
ncbi:uncharacterized protein BCR38DRAFT_211414 [Pseudomassariella vexata]|uniref:SWIM-type domain-containing protein n=1 Tax=Pseudomassariella vexata TaxID=1141098 RepID=A0A1Y2DYC0_9PEZI|nr:uncharacterized protein BCR38DRAFT_211414 [Pseudomassariella vexata]ORY64292.1 hypothetical protein BCR38DRAFT_211414 [Pseudomassariella vexata]